ncbi:MAG: ethanolamine utilization protein EutN [Candidatus Latescibacteria bacterium]|nr:ethanolamine utilization protein EutN [Candidatus Latescibacterota bacterium]
MVLGSVTSTIKHPCLNGKKLMIVQVLDAKGQPQGRPQVVVDFTASGKGDRVILNWDGIGSQEMHNDPIVPQRAWLCGIIDDIVER